jgi:hypothetical protein
MNVHLNTIEKLKQSQELIDLYRDHISSESLTGVITDYSDTFVYLSLFSDEGLPNGIAIAYIADVTRIRWGGNVRLSVKQLISAKQSVALAPAIPLDSLKDVIQSVQTHFGYVNVLTERVDEDVTFIGEVVEIDEQALVLHGFGTMRSRDSNHMLLGLENISRIDAEAPYEKSIHFLFMQDRKKLSHTE